MKERDRPAGGGGGAAAGVGGAAEEESELAKEARLLWAALAPRLDALSHFVHAPKPVVEDLSVRPADLPALAMEEVAPAAASAASLRAPEEVRSPCPPALSVCPLSAVRPPAARSLSARCPLAVRSLAVRSPCAHRPGAAQVFAPGQVAVVAGGVRGSAAGQVRGEDELTQEQRRAARAKKKRKGMAAKAEVVAVRAKRAKQKEAADSAAAAAGFKVSAPGLLGWAGFGGVSVFRAPCGGEDPRFNQVSDNPSWRYLPDSGLSEPRGARAARYFCMRVSGHMPCPHCGLSRARFSSNQRFCLGGDESLQ